MPYYDYFCEANGRTVQVRHRMNVVLRTWGEVCYAAQVPLGDTEALAPVRKVLSAPSILLPVGDSELKEKGFTKLVRRDDGNYENVTALDGEPRVMKRDEPATVPDLSKKIRD